MVYKVHLKLKSFRYNLDFYLIIRESLLYVLYTNRLYTAQKDSTGYEKIIRSATLEYELNRQKGHVLIKALITSDEFSKKVQSLDDVLAGVDEEFGENWKLYSNPDIFTNKFPASIGYFYKDIISGHIASSEVANDPSYLGKIYYDQRSHYFIDGCVGKSHIIPVLCYNTVTQSYNY